MKKRIEEIDLIKGIGIMGMVMCHAGISQIIISFIYMFHMAVFFIASGYTYQNDYSKSIHNIIGFLKRRIKLLWLPYFLSTVVFTMCHNLFIKINIYTDNPLIIEVLSGKNVYLQEYLTNIEIIKNIIKAIFMLGYTQIGGALWFLKVLFYLSIGYAMIDWIIIKILGNKYRLHIQGILSIFFLLCGFLFQKEGITVGGIGIIFSCYFMFFLGNYFKLVFNNEKKSTNQIKIISIIVSFFVLIIMSRYGEINLSSNSYPNPIFLVTASISGWFFLWYVSYYLKLTKKIKKVVILIGKKSLIIVILHFLSFKVISYIGVVIMNQPLYLVAAFPVLYTNKWWWILYSVIGLCIPLLCDYFYFKLKKRYLF